MRYVDLTGRRFGLLVAIERDHERSTHRAKQHSYWVFQCDCGQTKTIRSDGVLSGAVQSCGHVGVLNRTKASVLRCRTHGMTSSSEFSIWSCMIQRCTNPKVRAWPYYGGRGIRVCERWLDFRNFIADMGRKPDPRLEIDRIDNDGNYEPGNCRWVTHGQNQSNKRPLRRDWHGRILPRAAP